MKLISIVVPMYNEEPMVPIFFERIDQIIDDLSHQYMFEIVAVNDGSKDKTLELLLEVQKSRPHLRIVNLSRNFGHEPAVAAGIKVAKGDAVIPLDADLQDPPEIIPALIEKWEDGYEVVNARRATRKEDTYLKKTTAKMFYNFMTKVSGKIKVPANVGHYRLMSRRVVDEVNKLPEKTRVLRVEVPYVGFKTTEVVFDRKKREAGKTHYNFKSMFDLAINAIISSTLSPVYWPLTLAFTMTGISGLSLFIQFILFIINAANNTLLTRVNHPLWLTINMILLIGSLILLVLAVIAIYVGKTFNESQGRPFYIIDEVIEAKKEED
ncbi:MAG: glycosyltransferase family 2 protein [Erysipelotrichaceae bacterium]|nr:glycosyltransferase family 2 protein [Erysipelotrichaceae bacterium]